jgi:glycosyltransferase involved in cell wall biosynthesis
MRGHLEAANYCLRGEAGATGSSNVRANGEAGQSALRLAIVMPSAHPRGGSEEALVQLLRSQGAAGLVVGLLVFLEDGELRAVCEGLGVEVKVVKGGRLREPWKHAAAVLRIARLLKTHHIEMVLGWMTKAHIYSGIAGKLARVPAVYYQHGLPDDGAVDRLSRKIPAAGALGCSEFVAREQQARVTYPVLGVPVAADTQRFEDAAGVPAGRKCEISLGLARGPLAVRGRASLNTWKCVIVCAEAMAAVCAEIPGTRGVIVGGLHDLEPDYEPWLRNRIKELGMTEKIRMVGVQRNIPDWMQAMDVVVHASEREPFGIVVVEAMSLGKPVVATLPGGPEEIITDGTDGRLVPWNRPDALAKPSQISLDPDCLFRGAKQRSRSIPWRLCGATRSPLRSF